MDGEKGTKGGNGNTGPKGEKVLLDKEEILETGDQGG